MCSQSLYRSIASNGVVFTPQMSTDDNFRIDSCSDSWIFKIKLLIEKHFMINKEVILLNGGCAISEK